MGNFVHAVFVGAIRVITVLFGIGLIGCAAVLVLTFVEDVKTMFASQQ